MKGPDSPVLTSLGYTDVAITNHEGILISYQVHGMNEAIDWFNATIKRFYEGYDYALWDTASGKIIATAKATKITRTEHKIERMS